MAGVAAIVLPHPQYIRTLPSSCPFCSHPCVCVFAFGLISPRPQPLTRGARCCVFLWCCAPCFSLCHWIAQQTLVPYTDAAVAHVTVINTVACTACTVHTWPPCDKTAWCRGVCPPQHENAVAQTLSTLRRMALCVYAHMPPVLLYHPFVFASFVCFVGSPQRRTEPHFVTG